MERRTGNVGSFFLWIAFLGMVGLLAYMKEAPQTDAVAETTAIVRWEIPHIEIAGAFVAAQPVTVADFQRFVDATDYKTWRERRHVAPVWSGDPSDQPVRWLSRDDAMAYCRWVQRIWNGNIAVRLPSAEELKAVGSHQWEWTHQSLADFNGQNTGVERYLSAYLGSEDTLRHRRAEDMADNTIADVSFRIVWR
ncbi:MAG: SUMF1/EgtB/PvdO family nonheme iron enzyme [Chlamydiia bacterium]|nr:SUMF1/EgtB/PvdO family nonheme iron enzyme [Chlamydiia bacterium]